MPLVAVSRGTITHHPGASLAIVADLCLDAEFVVLAVSIVKRCDNKENVPNTTSSHKAHNRGLERSKTRTSYRMVQR